MEILKNQNINAVIKSDLNLEREDSNAIIINATGKLDSLYDFAEIAFIGGSLFKNMEDTISLRLQRINVQSSLAHT